ncbi:adapter protein MecA 1/2 [Natranaerovirga hydrolytica]|uniref:Adapter protein MecA 1/2 n=1 Tax=Natranaerovirga hydrolytica TaxID=680378 RepID=A0A4V2Q1W9_9FIRM|nr:adaptor protein MecA [Natranaerovirga hydrolytica]TCK99722.1 adapter protein MecA 1/2 [Natranaerovirga hydrolytica]
MKLEKVNENQIKCTLNKSDLSDREIKLSELAYGTEKAQELFRDMMEQASFEFGFEVDDVPLMIEAIPLSTESIILIITKVDNPEDLETKFANLTSNIKRFKKKKSQQDTLRELSSNKKTEEKSKNYDKKFSVKSDEYLLIYTFNNLDDIILLSNNLDSMYTGINSLYKDNKNQTYYLVLHKSDFDDIIFKDLSTVLSEFGTKVLSTYATEAYYNEHYDVIIKNNALQNLSKL